MIARTVFQETIQNALDRSRVVTLIDPRQCGKTTMARLFVPSDSINYFDLEDPLSLTRLDQPMTALQDLRGLVVIDEVERRPDLFPIVRILVDRTPMLARFLILGSASPDLLRQSSESLAGRISIITMSGFSLAEVGAAAQNQLWRQGGFPLSFTLPAMKPALNGARVSCALFLSAISRNLVSISLPPACFVFGAC